MKSYNAGDVLQLIEVKGLTTALLQLEPDRITDDPLCHIWKFARGPLMFLQEHLDYLREQQANRN